MKINILTDLFRLAILFISAMSIYYIGYSTSNLHSDAMCPVPEPVIKYMPSTERAMDCNRLGGDYLFYLDQDMNLQPRESCRIDKLIDTF